MKTATCQSPGGTRSRVVSKGVHHEEVETTTPGGKTLVWHRSTFYKQMNSDEHRCEETNDDPGVARNDKRRLDYNKESRRERYLKQKGGITAAAACCNRARSHERCGDLSQAKAEYLAAFTFSPRHVDALFGLAVCFQKQGDLTAAEDKYRAAIEIDPKHTGCHFNLAMLLYGRSDLVGALAHNRAVIECDPEPTRWRNAEARKEIRMILGEMCAESFVDLGRFLKEEGDLNGAAAKYRAAAAIDPKGAYYHYDLGIILEDSSDSVGAEAAYRAAIECATGRPSNVLLEAHLRLGDILEGRGDMPGVSFGWGKARVSGDF